MFNTSNFPLIFVLILTPIIVVMGQEILQSKSCKITTCEAKEILKKVEGVEQSLNSKINAMKKEVEEKFITSYTTPPYTTTMSQGPVTLSLTKTTVRTENDHESTTTTAATTTIIPLPTADFAVANEFYLMFPGNSAERYIQLMLSSETSGKAEIYIPHLNSLETLDLNIGTIYKNISTDIRAQAVTVEEYKGIYVRTSTPVLLYAMYVRTDEIVPYVFPILRRQNLSKTYIANVHDGNNIGVVAISDNTVVNIQLHMSTNVVYNGRLYRNGEIMTLMLNRFSTFKLVSTSITSGTNITSNHPVAVFHGQESKGYKQLHNQLGWGTTFLIPGRIIKSVTSPYNFLCVTPQMNNINTQVTLNTPNSKTQYNISETNRRGILPSEFYILNTDKPVSVSFYDGMSYFLMVPPVTQFGFRFTCALPAFNRPYTPAYENHVYILTESQSIDGIKVNDDLLDEDDIKGGGSVEGFHLTFVSVNMREERSASVSSQLYKVFVFVLGFSHDYLTSHPYVYQCTSY